MKASSSPTPCQHNEETLLAFLVSESNYPAVNQYLQNHYQIESGLDKESAGAGRENLWMTADKKILLYGIGNPSKLENVRKAAHSLVEKGNEWRMKKLAIHFEGEALDGWETAATEASLLSNYQFLPYKSDKTVHSLAEVIIVSAGSEAQVEKGAKIARATMVARDLTNEPVITLTATELSNRAVALGKEFGFKTEVFNKSRIQSLKMGGLLAVNLGSIEPPTFTIMEWKPKNATNSQPVILVGKGVVYDTGGLSLKPTANSMDFMKADMGGASAVIGALCGAAALELPVHIIGLVPATDNRPGQNAYTPGDVITMFDGSTVEVLNTDAEGRMLLADALAYAKKYDPALVIDLATLTGAAVVAVGTIGIAMMSTAKDAIKSSMEASGQHVHERVVELPLWEEYGDLLKSDIADCKNIGGRTAGSITAGKFLERFTDYPWVHLDIAGPAFLHAPDSYRGKNGTGVGVRLLLDFLTNYQG